MVILSIYKSNDKLYFGGVPIYKFYRDKVFEMFYYIRSDIQAQTFSPTLCRHVRLHGLILVYGTIAKTQHLAILGGR